MNNNFKRRITIILLGIFTFLLLPFNSLMAFAEGNQEGGMNIEARSALLIEPTSGTVIYEKNPDEKYAPASVTKIMTMLLAMEAVDSGKIKLNDKITCSENAKKMGGSTMLLDTGEVRTVEEILKGIAIASGNDAAVAMAEYLGGTESDFVGMMNKRAEELGMKNTQFKNCNGLPADGHYSTARDISLMSLELLKHPTILKYSGIYMETISEGRKSPIELVNHNKLVRFFPGCDGLKTGYTQEAKYCISATAKKDGVRMLTVIMGAPSFKVRNRDAGILMNHGFSKYEGKTLCKKDDEVEKVLMGKSTDKFFMAKAKTDLVVVLPKGSKEQVCKKVAIDELKDSYKAGDVVGKVEIFLGEKKVGEVEIYSDRDIEKPGIFEKLKYKASHLFGGDDEDGVVEEKKEDKKDKKDDKKDSKKDEKIDSKKEDKKDSKKDDKKEDKKEEKKCDSENKDVKKTESEDKEEKDADSEVKDDTKKDKEEKKTDGEASEENKATSDQIEPMQSTESEKKPSEGTEEKKTNTTLDKNQDEKKEDKKTDSNVDEKKNKDEKSTSEMEEKETIDLDGIVDEAELLDEGSFMNEITPETEEEKTFVEDTL